MKELTVGGVAGLLFAMGIIYWLSPLNNGAIALVIIISTGITSAMAKMLSPNSSSGNNDE